MKYATVCSGIEAPSMAWDKPPLNWEPQWFSEIEAFPSAVLAHHYPNVPNLGDMTKIHETETFKQSTLDLLCGGTPCQSFSVAGLRKGMDDERGNLALEFIKLAARKRPRWVLWENVPGVLSSSNGRDFASFLAGLTGRHIEPPKKGWKNSGIIEGIPEAYGVAWRVLDAQYFGVAQRRRRVFVVGCLGDWRGAAAVLFERDSLSGHPAPSRETRKEVTELAGTLAANGGGLNRPAGNANELDFCVVQPLAVGFSAGNSSESRGIGYTVEGTPPLRAGMSGTNQVPTIAQCVDVCPTLRAGGNKTGGDRPPGTDVDTVESLISVFDPNQITSPNNRSQPTPELCHTLPAKANSPIVFGIDEECNVSDNHFGPLLRGPQGGTRQAVAYGFKSGQSEAAGDVFVTKEYAPTLQAQNNGSTAVPAVAVTKETPSQSRQHMAVRRLLPTECETLQGFKKGYTDIMPNGKPTADGSRYKALGNSMAVPCMEWLGKRIQMVSDLIGESYYPEL